MAVRPERESVVLELRDQRRGVLVSPQTQQHGKKSVSDDHAVGRVEPDQLPILGDGLVDTIEILQALRESEASAQVRSSGKVLPERRCPAAVELGTESALARGHAPSVV